jgi:hypothetical protein
MKHFRHLLLIICAIAQIGLHAQFNTCDDAIPIFCTNSIQGSNINGNDTPIPDCFNPGSNALRKTVWYQVVGDGSIITASTCGAFTTLDTQISVYEAPCQGGALSLTCVTRDDDGCGFSGGGSVATWASVPGQGYLVAVFGYANQTGNFQLDLTCASTPCPNSVSVTSNGPICDGEDAVYSIGPSPGADPTPGGLVTYLLDGVANFVYLDNNGEQVVEQASPPVGVPGSVIQLTEIRNQNNLCPLSLSNGASVLVNPLPNSLSVTSNGPICEGELGQYIIAPSPGADPTPNGTVIFELDGIGYSAPLDINGLGIFDLNGLPGGLPIATPPTSIIQLISVSDVNGCELPLSNGASILVNELPNSVSATSNGPICEGELGQYFFAPSPSADPTPNGIVTYDLDGTTGLTIQLDASGMATLDVSGLSTGTSSIQLTSVSNAGGTCDIPLSNGASILVNESPNSVSATSNGPICEGELGQYFFAPSPGADPTPNGIVTYDLDGTTGLTIQLDATGMASLDVNGLSTGTSIIQLTSVSNAGETCDISLSNGASILVNEVPNSVSVTSNGPICEGELGQYFFAPSPGADPTPNGIVTYDLDGTTGLTIQLDASGMATLDVSGLSAGTSNIQLTSVSNAGGTCNVSLSNGASIEVRPNPIIPTYEFLTPNPICEGITQVDLITGSPGAEVVFTANGATNTITLNANGEDSGTLEFVAGTWTIQLVSTTLDGCTVDLTGEPPVILVVNELPEITSYTSNAPICETDDLVYSFTGTPNASFNVEVESNIYSSIFDGFGHSNITFVSGAFSSGSYDLNLVDVTLNGCTTDLSNEAALTSVIEPTPLNSICSDAILMSCTDTQFGNTICATESTIPDAFNGGMVTRKGLWYKYTGDGSTINATACNTQTNFDTKITIFDGSCGTLNPVAFDDNGCGNLSSVAVLATTPGTQYYIFIYGNNGAVGDFGLSIGCANSPCPSSVSAISNGPICENDIGIYTIQPSPTVAASPGAIVYYTLDGVPDFVYLDVNGEATITTGPLPVGIPASILELDEIRSASNLCPMTLSNGASIEVRQNPLIPTYEFLTPNPICEGITQVDLITGSPGAEVVFTANGATNTITLNANGEDSGTLEFVAGTWTIQLVSTTLDGCTVDLTGEPPVILVVEDCTDPCDEDIILASPDDDIAGGAFIASTDKSIFATNTITGLSSVDYVAGTTQGEAIELNPGFEVGPDAIFHAYMDGCFVPALREDTERVSRTY